MRLAFISPFGLTPKATLSHRILPLAKALSKKGHDVTIVIPPYTNPGASGHIENRAELKIVNILLPGNFFYSLRIGLRLARAVRDFSPERVCIFKPKGYSALCGMMLWFMGKRYPLYLDIDDLESDKGMEERMGYRWWERSFFRYEEKWLLKRVEKVTVASQYLMKFYGEKLGRDKVHYLPNGPANAGGMEEENCKGNDTGSIEHLQKELGLQEKKIVLLYTRFTECALKDIVDFVKLFSKRFPEGILLVVGEGYGRERGKVTAEIEKEGLSDFVLFTGWVKREQLKKYLSLGEVAIYPMADTTFNLAKCSAKLIELMAMGKPIVASPVGEVLAYIRDGESGLLARDIETMVRKVIMLLDDREKAENIGKEARRFLYDNFSWDELISAFNNAK